MTVGTAAPLAKQSRVPIGGAPRAVPRLRKSLPTLSASTPQLHGSKTRVERQHKTDGKTRVGNYAGAETAYSDVGKAAIKMEETAIKMEADRHRSSIGKQDSNQRLNTAVSEPSLRQVVETSQTVDLMAGAKSGKLSHEAAPLPPWSCPLNTSIRYQPTTLIYKVHKIPEGLAAAARSLDARRYQPTSADHGLAFRLRHAVPGGSTATLERIGRSSEKPPREGVPTPAVGPGATAKCHYPTWWGLPGEISADRPSYEDLGEHYAEEGIPKERFDQYPVSKECLPRLNGRFEHKNPFIAQFVRRSPGGLIVCDVSVNR